MVLVTPVACSLRNRNHTSGSTRVCIARLLDFINRTRKPDTAVFLISGVDCHYPAPSPSEVGASRESWRPHLETQSARWSSSCPSHSLRSKLFPMELPASRHLASLGNPVSRSLASLDNYHDGAPRIPVPRSANSRALVNSHARKPLTSVSLNNCSHKSPFKNLAPSWLASSQSTEQRALPSNTPASLTSPGYRRLSHRSLYAVMKLP